MDDLISRRAAIDAANDWLLDCLKVQKQSRSCGLIRRLEDLPSAQPENQVHLCDSCRHVYPECPSGKNDVIFGNGKGNDNICACNKYDPSAQPEQSEPCDLCSNLEKGDTLYQYSDWDGGIGFDYIRDIQYCPKCGRRLE